MSINITYPPDIDPTTDIVVICKGGLVGMFSYYGNEILEWCLNTGVDADFHGHWYNGDQYLSAWRILDDQQRIIFALKWSTMPE